MPGKGYRVVAVRVQNGTVTCNPDPAQCYWETGPDCIRWTFKDVPDSVASVIVQWQTPGGVYRDIPMFKATGASASSVGGHLPDVITYGNCTVQGKFKYAVICLDASGSVVAQADPDSENNPNPP